MGTSMTARAIGAAVVFLFLPTPLFASVVISEFLYDAPGSDAEQEYIEIYNAGTSAVDLSKWKVNDGSNHALNAPPKNGGSGSIILQSGSYALLVDNASTFLSSHQGLLVSVIDSAFSLPNLGGTLMLIGEDGAAADTIVYTKDIGAAGDGNSLHRASVGGAQLSAGAPSIGTGALPAPSGGAGSATTTLEAQPAPAASPAPVSSYVPPPMPTLFADAGADKWAVVGADIEFRGRAYNRDKELVDNVRFVWNFGDGTLAEGPLVKHHFDYPGRYAVVLSIAENRDSASDKMIVTAEPAQLSFSAEADGSAVIRNNAPRDLDLSDWLIRSFRSEFILPPETIVLSSESLRLSPKTLGFYSGTHITLHYPNGALALTASSSSESAVEPPRTPPAVKETLPASPPVETAHSSSVEKEADEAVVPKGKDEATTEAVSTSSQIASSAVAASPYWIGALILAGLGASAAYLARRRGERGWEIIDESAEIDDKL